MSSQSLGLGKGRRGDDRLERSRKERERLRAKIVCAMKAYPYDKTNLAQKLAVSPSNVSKWHVPGGPLPGIDLIEPLAMALGVTPGWFWSSEPAPTWEVRARPVSPRSDP